MKITNIRNAIQHICTQIIKHLNRPVIRLAGLNSRSSSSHESSASTAVRPDISSSLSSRSSRFLRSASFLIKTNKYSSILRPYFFLCLQHIGQHSFATSSCLLHPLTTFPSHSVWPSTVALQFYVGLPLFLSPPVVTCWDVTHFIARWVSQLYSILCTRPSHLKIFLLKIPSILPIPVLCLTSSFVILWFQVIPKILLNHVKCAAFNFLLFVTVMDHASLPHFRVVNTRTHTTISQQKQNLLFMLVHLVFLTSRPHKLSFL